MFFTLRPAFAIHFSLTAEDADMVDIIHSDRGFFGFPSSTGTVDFHPNGGTRYQPGCNAILQLTTNEGSKKVCSLQNSTIKIKYYIFSMILIHSVIFDFACINNSIFRFQYYAVINVPFISGLRVSFMSETLKRSL